ncbi:MAG: HAMP domain-containing histidine kinase [Gemmatimonadaceae bacterium]|nr:HAMP domain-containing histidine kinase [Gemmatimonadaceae bacterium]
MPSRLSRAVPTRVTLLVVLLMATVLVSARLAYEAHQAARAERMTAERALREYAAMAAWEFRSDARQRLEGEVLRALGMVVVGTAASPYEPPLALSTLAASAEGAFPCMAGDSAPPRALARLDLRSGERAIWPEGVPDEVQAALFGVLARAGRTLPVPEAPWRLDMATIAGRRSAVVMGVRFARLGTPIAVYALTACPSAVERRIPDAVMREHRLLPAVTPLPVPNDSLLAVRVRRGAQEVLRLGRDDGTVYRGSAEWSDAALTIDVSLRRDAAGRLAVGTPERSNVPLLVGLLALTAALGAVALVQIRREHELARLRADFTSSVSHELRTPLAQILLFGETLSLERARTPREARQAAETIVQEARRLMHMVENILHFSRSSRGAAPLQLEPVDLGTVAREVATAFVPLAESSGGALTWELRDAPCVRGDVGAIRQVLLNLLDNAVKYGVPSRGVHLAVWRAGDEGVVRVDDAGAGIPASDRSRIWLPYVRLTSAGDSGRGGSGLGLAVVQELAVAMHARVWVEEGPRGGAAFCLALPLAAEATAGAPASRPGRVA